MIVKIKKLFGSLKFWIVTLTAIATLLTMVADGTMDTVSLIELIRNWLAVVATIGVVDGVAERMSGNKSN